MKNIYHSSYIVSHKVLQWTLTVWVLTLTWKNNNMDILASSALSDHKAGACNGNKSLQRKVSSYTHCWRGETAFPEDP